MLLSNGSTASLPASPIRAVVALVTIPPVASLGTLTCIPSHPPKPGISSDKLPTVLFQILLIALHRASIAAVPKSIQFCGSNISDTKSHIPLNIDFILSPISLNLFPIAVPILAILVPILIPNAITLPIILPKNVPII